MGQIFSKKIVEGKFGSTAVQSLDCAPATCVKHLFGIKEESNDTITHVAEEEE